MRLLGDAAGAHVDDLPAALRVERLLPVRESYGLIQVQGGGPWRGLCDSLFQPLPLPSGAPPYHMTLDSVLPPDQMAAIEKSGRILMHFAGDTGGVKAPQSQQITAMAMEEDFNYPDATMRPAFFPTGSQNDTTSAERASSASPAKFGGARNTRV